MQLQTYWLDFSFSLKNTLSHLQYRFFLSTFILPKSLFAFQRSFRIRRSPITSLFHRNSELWERSTKFQLLIKLWCQQIFFRYKMCNMCGEKACYLWGSFFRGFIKIQKVYHSSKNSGKQATLLEDDSSSLFIVQVVPVFWYASTWN